VRVVLSWLRDLCPTDLAAEELAELLGRKGAEVGSIERPWAGLSGVIVARVLEVRDHPDSDKLCIARVQTGSGEQEVVVGVRNMGVGDLVPLASPGARVVGLPDPLGAREIRGVTSNGMLCAPDELGVSSSHEGILILPPELEIGWDVVSTSRSRRTDPISCRCSGSPARSRRRRGRLCPRRRPGSPRTRSLRRVWPPSRSSIGTGAHATSRGSSGMFGTLLRRSRFRRG